MISVGCSGIGVKAWWWVLALGHRVGPLAHSRGASAPRRGAGTPISLRREIGDRNPLAGPARWPGNVTANAALFYIRKEKLSHQILRHHLFIDSHTQARSARHVHKTVDDLKFLVRQVVAQGRVGHAELEDVAVRHRGQAVQ